MCQISTRRDVEARAPGGRRLRCAGARTTRVSITGHRSDRVRVGAASIPIGGASSSDADPTAEDDVGTPAPKDDATLTDIAPEPKSKFLRSIGVTNGILGVSQDRVEMVARQALPVMGGMASQNVLNLADSAMVGRLGTACVAAVGISSTLNFQCQAALQGISSGVQAMSA